MKTIFTIILLITTIALNASVIYVKNVDSNAWEGKESVYNNLQEAINEANDYDSLWIASGIYYPTESYNGSSDKLYFSFTLKKSISLFGGFIGDEKSLSDRKFADKNGDGNIAPYEFINETIFSSDFNNDDNWSVAQNSPNQWKYENTEENSFHVIYINDKNRSTIEIEINGITIQSGSGSNVYNNYGSGINGNFSCKSKFSIQNCIVKKNLSNLDGSAIRISIASTDSSYFEIRNNSFLNNSTPGGILYFFTSYKASKPLINISHNEIKNNDGNGLIVNSSSNLNVNINSNFFTHNISNSVGGVSIKTNNANTQLIAKINNNSFVSNIGNDGGAIKMNYFIGSFDIQASNNNFITNTAKNTGGAVSIESTKESNGSILFDNNIIISNQSINSNGGAFYINTKRTCNLIISSNIISNNKSGALIFDGAITCYNGYIQLINNLINNSNVGGVYISSSGGGTLINNTIAYNDYAGVIIDNDENEVSIYNSLIVNNRKDSNLGSTNYKDCNNITGNLDCFKNPPSYIGYKDDSYNYSAFDFNLTSHSNAINKGRPDTTNMLLPSTDLEGKPRVIGDTIDIGAFESELSTYSFSIEDNSDISIFPNPCSRNIHIKNITPSTNIYIFNSTGNKVGAFVSNSNNLILDLSYLERGVYYLRINNIDAVYQTKFLKL